MATERVIGTSVVSDRAAEPSSSDSSTDSLGDMIQLVKDYARQEALGPLKGWGRYLALGAMGALVLGIGLIIAMLGVLRLLQTETDAFSGPSSSIVAYAITLVGCLVVIGLSFWQISRRKSLQRKEPKS